MKAIYLAPLEGVTDNIYRTTFAEYYGGVDKYFTPFLSPCSTFKFTTREFDEINPEKNNVDLTVPQLLTNNAKHFLWAVGEIIKLGYKEINFNLGCPSGTVVAKKKGCGLLFYPDLLDKLLYEIFEKLPSLCGPNQNVPLISIKTRLGKADPEEFYDILEIFNKYPISEITLHPRIQTDFYGKPIRPEFIDYALLHTKTKIVLNGEIKTIQHIKEAESKYQAIESFMIGRGLITNPELALNYKDGTKDFDMEKFCDFQSELLSKYEARFSGDKPVLYRMKEFWAFWQEHYQTKEKALKQIRKAKTISDYKNALRLL
ncbi:MAG: tRNA-dihydrouridine synthase family protein [Acetatifactor sp.]|nr:tRNA-dihydrouridine synthase family protein [Acetatifactor sp.]